MKPFDNNTNSEQIGGLTVENGLSEIALYGQTSIRRDKTGLAQAIALHKLLTDIVHQLASEPLPDTLPEQEAQAVDNPFV